MYRLDLPKALEGVLVINDELQAVEIQYCNLSIDQNPTITVIALDGARARNLIERFSKKNEINIRSDF